ncbi:MAG: thermonuclease family protein [Caldilineaceae bacterium]|nr:thermonuclease family protein [Caldilineaceae bacterium]
MFARRHNAVLLALLFFSLAVAVPLYAAPLPQLDFPLSGIVNSNANLRAGPGTSFAVVGGARAGETVDVIGCNTACDWYELPADRWVAAFLVDLQARPPGDPAQVVDVVDGDTIEVLLDGVTYRLRYIGMDAPELSEDWGDQAAAANAALVDGQTVYLETDVSDTDPFGRLLRHVWLADGTLVGEDLVRQGYAYAASYPPDVKYQERIGLAQEAALEAERGFWGEAVTPTPTPTAPTRSQSLPTVNTTANLRAGRGPTTR